MKTGFFLFKHNSENYLNEEVMSGISYYTPEGLKKLREELGQLKDVERLKASRAIAEARDKGDLSENAEYDARRRAARRRRPPPPPRTTRGARRQRRRWR